MTLEQLQDNLEGYDDISPPNDTQIIFQLGSDALRFAKADFDAKEECITIYLSRN